MAGSFLTVSWAFTSLSLLMLVTVLSRCLAYGCPLNCRCLSQNSTEKENDLYAVPTSQAKKKKEKQTGNKAEVKVVCQNVDVNITRTFISNLPKGISVLDLSGNKLKLLEANAFQGLSTLLKLNLSYNPIASVQSNTFKGLDNLDLLSLSGTKLNVLNASMFEGLHKLTKLYLLDTVIEKIQPGTFDGLRELNRLRLQTDVLECDCHLQWMITWLGDWHGRLNGSAVCKTPSELKGKSLKKLTKADLVCADSLKLQVFELAPSTNQIVFAGDKLPFHCRVSIVDPDINMSWLHNDKLIVSNRTLGIFIHDESLPNQMLLTTMVLERLTIAHTGSWKCLVESAKGRAAKSVSIVVLAENTGSCARTVTETSRGTYDWPKTVAGIVQELSCKIPPSGSQNAVARHKCNMNGVWTGLDVTQCPFTSQKTRELEAIYFSLRGTNGSCQGNCGNPILQRITDISRVLGNVENMNVEDVVFLSRIISTFSKNPRNIEVVKSLVNLSSSVMEINSTLLIAAQRMEQACSRIVRAIEDMAEQLLRTNQSVDLNSKNIAVQAHTIQPYLFTGINCSSWMGGNQTILVCIKNSYGRSADRGQFNASIRIPTDIMTQIQCASSVCPQNDTIRIQAVTYSNAKLFPVDENLYPFHVSSAVISSRIAGVRIVNSSSQITVAVLSPKSGRSKMPVHWDFSANGKQGAWLSTGCVMTSDVSPVVTFKCNHLTNFAVAEGRLPPLTAFEAFLLSCYNTGAVTYIGSAVVIVCLTTVFVVYIIHRGNIQMSRKMRHAVANLCLCLGLLFIVYTFGVRLYHFPIPCRIVGVVLHYLSLCTLFWLTVITFKILHHLSKQLTSQPPPEELSSEPPKPKPIIAGYLLGWGVAIIICGIGGAINWSNYEQFKKYCFLPKDAALTTVFVPAGILGFFNVVLFLRIFCLIQRIPSPAPSSATMKTADEPGLEETQDNEIQLLSSNQLTNSGTDTTTHGSNHSSSPYTSYSGPVDKVYGPGSQLCAVILTLILYCLTWLAGAFAVTLPVENVLPHHDIMFQCLYAVLASALGAFILVFYCVGRKDIRHSCCSKCALLSRWKYVPANGDATSKSPLEEPAVSEIPLGAETASLADKSVNSNGVDGSKASSTAAVPHPSAGLEPSFTTVVDSSIFYNPHQNGIAKKYWERSKKRRIVQLRKEVVGGAPVDDIELLGTRNGGVMTGQGIGCVPMGFCADLEVQIEQPNTAGNEKLPPTSKTDRPPLPAPIPLSSNELHLNNEVLENLVTTSKSNPRPQSTDLERSAVSSQNELRNLPNGIKRSRLSTQGMPDLNRTCDSFHEPIENGFLEQLELRIPPQAVPVKEPPTKSDVRAKVKNVGSAQNVANASASYDEKTSLTVSDHRDDDLNGNKDSGGQCVKRTGTSNCGLPSKKVVQAGSGPSPRPSSISSQEPKSPVNTSTLSEDSTLDIWEEQQKVDLKVETSV